MKSTAKKGATLQTISDQLKRVQLIDMRLLEGHCKLSKLRGTELPDNAHQDVKLSIKLQESEKIIVVLVSYQLGVSYDKTPDFDQSSTIIVRARYLITYKHDTGIKPEILLPSIRPTAVMNSWAFWREYVQSCTTRMGLPAFPIPLINLAALVDDETKAATKAIAKARKKVPQRAAR